MKNKKPKFIAFDLEVSPDVMYHLDRWYYERWGYYVLDSINRYIYSVPPEEEEMEVEFDGEELLSSMSEL